MATYKTKYPAPTLVSEHGQGGGYLPAKATASGTSGAGVTTPDYGTAGTAGSAGYTPDYASLISNDPLLRQQAGDLSAQGIASAADRRAQSQRALIQFGEVPDLQNSIQGLGLDPNSAMYRMLFGDVDERTRQAAQALTNAHLSTSWGLSNNHAANVDDLMSKLAARGMVRSGATVSGLGMEDQNYNQAQFSSRNDLLQYLAGVQAAFAQGESDRQRQLASATTDATTRQIAQNPYVAPVAPIPGTRGTSPTTLPNTDGFTSSADYFRANPLAQGTSTQDALGALGESTRLFGEGSTSIYGNGGLPKMPTFPWESGTAATPTATTNAYRAPATVAPPAPTPAPTAPTSYTNSVVKRLNLPE